VGSWVKWILTLVALVSVLLWFFTRDVVPRPIRIAASNLESQEYRVATGLGDVLADSHRPVKLLAGDGSRDNIEKLRAGEADLAVAKCGSVNLQGLEVVAPLYPDALLFVVRRGRNIHRISDLVGKKVLVGLELSGTHELARIILKHYQLVGTLQESQQYFTNLTKDPTLDAAFVATALTNPDLVELMSSEEFEILPIDQAEALATLFPYFHTISIPAGMFLGGGPVPPRTLQTLALPCLLIGDPQSSPRMIDLVLGALYEHRMRQLFPTLYTQEAAANWSLTPMHPASRNFYDPYRGLGTVTAFLSSLTSLKELMVASVALIWLGMERYRRAQEKHQQAALSEQKERLGAFINQTIQLEEQLVAQMDDPIFLQELFVKVSQLKVQALRELTHEALRSDLGFAIFLSQCRDLVDQIQRIQGRLK